jgi:hypothetical protein
MAIQLERLNWACVWPGCLQLIPVLWQFSEHLAWTVHYSIHTAMVLASGLRTHSERTKSNSLPVRSLQ